MSECKKKIGKVFTSKSVGNGPSSYEKRIYRAALSQRLRNTALGRNQCILLNSDAVRAMSRFILLHTNLSRN